MRLLKRDNKNVVCFVLYKFELSLTNKNLNICEFKLIKRDFLLKLTNVIKKYKNVSYNRRNFKKIAILKLITLKLIIKIFNVLTLFCI